MADLFGHIGITPIGALAVAVSAAAMYGVLSLVFRIWGRRLALNASIVGVGLVTLISAIAARAILGQSPTLAGGLVAIATLLVMEQSFGQIARAVGRWRPLHWGRSPVVVVVQGRLRSAALARHGLSDAQLFGLLRRQGIVDLAQVALAILEPTGSISVVRTGQRVDPALIEGVAGADNVPSKLFERSTDPD